MTNIVDRSEAGATAEVFHAIRKEGADVNQVRESDGNTAMHTAAKSGSFSILRLLIEKGANVDSVNHEGETPLMLAARNGNTQSSNVLLAAGANTGLTNAQGETASQIADEAGFDHIVTRISQGRFDPDAKPAVDDGVATDTSFEASVETHTAAELVNTEKKIEPELPEQPAEPVARQRKVFNF